jgi:hypothetical protein
VVVPVVVVVMTVMAVVMVMTVMTMMTVMTAVHHMPAATTVAAAVTATMAAAAVTAGFSTGGGESRHADSDRCGKGEDCNALEHVCGSLVCSAGIHSRRPCLCVAQDASEDCVGHHTIVESKARQRGTRPHR